MMKEYRFTILKGTWGISIGFKGNILSKDDSNREKISLNLGYSLIINTSLAQELKQMFINGLNWCLLSNEEFFNKQENKTIEIEDFSFSITDFQIEGLFYGAAEWLSWLYNHTCPEYKWRYDKDQNNYVFPDKEYLISTT